jgi:uncharacterized membrane protein required for colicin V production
MLTILDGIFLVILAGFVFYGLFFGLIRTIGTFAGVLLGAVIASRTYLLVFAWIQPVYFGYNNLGKVLTFIIIFSLVNRLVGFLFYLLDRAFHLIAILPFLKTFNRLGGAVLGFFTGSLILGLFIFVIGKYALITHWFGAWLAGSTLAPFFLKVNNLLLPLLPEILVKVKSIL